MGVVSFRPESGTMTESSDVASWMGSGAPRDGRRHRRQREDERHGQEHGSRQPPQRLHSPGFGTDVPLAQPRLSAVNRSGLSRAWRQTGFVRRAFPLHRQQYSTTSRLPLKPADRTPADAASVLRFT